MSAVDVFSIDGKKKGETQMPQVFEEIIRPDLILRAVNAENSLSLQPQGHYPLAGMDTTARYYGSMNSYRSGRHMGIAIRPREKLASGQQGKVKRIPSAVKGKRAHPHVVEMIQIERINKKEYRKAIASAISASVAKDTGKPIVVANEIESIKKTKAIIKLMGDLNLSTILENVNKSQRKGLRRSASVRRYTKVILLVVSKETPAIKAARNIAGVDACSVDNLSANALAPGGRVGRSVVWSEGALSKLDAALDKMEIRAR